MQAACRANRGTVSGYFLAGRSMLFVSVRLLALFLVLTLVNRCRSLMRGKRLFAVLDEVKVTND